VLEVMLGAPKTRLSTLPINVAETRPREDVQWKVRAEVYTRRADRGGQCPGQDLPPAFQVGASRAVIAKIIMA
jgi:hypothetical protein